MSDTQEKSLLLSGLDGANPLGFLAALGLLRVVSEASQAASPSLCWEPAGASWAPRLDSEFSDSEGSLLGLVDSQLHKSMDDHPIADALLRLQDERRDFLLAAANSSGVTDRVQVDSCASLAGDVENSDITSQLQTVRRDYFEGNLRSLLANTTIAHLQRTLFRTWDYADPLDNHSLHLDPSEDRRHALQWYKPSGDPTRKTSGGMIGANRLAIEAWPLFPTIPCDSTLRTTGFTGTRSFNTRWTWPLWNVPAFLPNVKAILSVTLLQSEEIQQEEARKLKAMGVAAAYRTRRILVGKTPNFTPTERIC